MTQDKRGADPTDRHEFRAGYVAIIGRPNVGKSTLVNRLLRQKLSIISPRPQTTWHRILGIKTLPHAQLLFLDTPGIHASAAVFNQGLVRAALRAMADADVILWVVDASQPEDEDDQLIRKELEARPPKAAVLLALNKVDLVDKPLLLPLIARWHAAYPFSEIVPVSAAKGENLDRLEEVLVRFVPSGHPFYPPEDLSDRPERFFIAEVIREQAFALLHQELPYAVAIEVGAVRARPGREDLCDVEATIYVEKDSQKAIVIGAGGEMLKRLGSRARPEIEELLGTRVYLRLWVQVLEGWRKDPTALKRFGYLEA